MACGCQGHPAPVYPVPPIGAGPGDIAATKSRASALHGLLAWPVAQLRKPQRSTPGHNIATGGYDNLQKFPTRPSLPSLVAPGIGLIAVLPGRMSPAGWDGEMGATSPHANMGGPG